MIGGEKGAREPQAATRRHICRGKTSHRNKSEELAVKNAEKSSEIELNTALKSFAAQDHRTDKHKSKRKPKQNK